MKKISFLTGINIKISLTIWYREYLEAVTDIEEEIIKVRKEVIYQQNYKAKVMVIYCIISQQEVMDRMLINIKLQNRDITKYISFQEIDLQTKLGALHENNMNNSQGKYKVLEGVKVHDVVNIEENKYWLRDYLLKVKFKGNRLFAAVE